MMKEQHMHYLIIAILVICIALVGYSIYKKKTKPASTGSSSGSSGSSGSIGEYYRGIEIPDLSEQFRYGCGDCSTSEDKVNCPECRGEQFRYGL